MAGFRNPNAVENYSSTTLKAQTPYSYKCSVNRRKDGEVTRAYSPTEVVMWAHVELCTYNQTN